MPRYAKWKKKTILDQPGIQVQEFQLLAPQGRPYSPLPGQIQFHRSNSKYRWFCGGVGSGKTLCGCIEVFMTALRYPGSTILVGRWSYKELRSVTWDTLLRVIPPALIADQHDNANDLDIILINGSKIVGWNLSNWQTIQGQNLSAWYIDELTELPDPDCFFELTRRLRSHVGPLRGWCTGTPNGRDWCYKLFALDQTGAYEVLEARTEENVHNPPEYAADLRRDLSDDDVARFLDAQFTESAGTIFGWIFDSRIHVVQPFRIPEHWPRYRGLDPGGSGPHSDPTAVLWAAVDEHGTVWIYDEHYVAGKVISENVAEILRKTGADAIEWTAADPFVISRRQPDSEKTLGDLYEDAGLRTVVPGGGSKETSISLIQELLKPDAQGEPRLKVFSTCTNLISELRYWKRTRVGKPEDRDDHAVAALRFMVLRSPAQAQHQFSAPVTNEIYDRFQRLLSEQDFDDYTPQVGSQGIPWTAEEIAALS